MPTNPPAPIEDDSFDLDSPTELSPEALARGTRYPSEAERAELLKNLAELPLPEDSDNAQKP